MTPEEYGIQWIKQMIKRDFSFSGLEDLEKKFRMTGNAGFSDEEIEEAIAFAWRYYRKYLLNKEFDNHFFTLSQFVNS